MADAVYPVSPAWRLLMRDLGLAPEAVLRHAGAAGDLFAREGATVTAEGFARLFRAVEAVAADPRFVIRIAEALSFEMFDPPVFAAMCSDDLAVALQRLSHYKRLCAPVALDVTVDSDATRIVVGWKAPPVEPPQLVFALELTYCVRLARLGTRSHVVPRAVSCPFALEPGDAFTAFFGVPVERGPEVALVFDATDAAAPFLTANAGMWSVFEPELRRRLLELDTRAAIAERMRWALLELLPSGRASVPAVASKLALSTRTLQRRLRDEGTTFQRVLDDTRGELARHYLGQTAMASAEISFLLGYEDPNSFLRAFRDWIGVTPEQYRARLREERRADGAVP